MDVRVQSLLSQDIQTNSTPRFTRNIGSSKKDYNEAQPTIRIRRLLHQLLERRRKGHRGSVQYYIGQHGIPTAREQRREEAAQERADCLHRSWIWRQSCERWASYEVTSQRCVIPEGDSLLRVRGGTSVWITLKEPAAGFPAPDVSEGEEGR
jgi:hypothetical protein